MLWHLICLINVGGEKSEGWGIHWPEYLRVRAEGAEAAKRKMDRLVLVRGGQGLEGVKCQPPAATGAYEPQPFVFKSQPENTGILLT